MWKLDEKIHIDSSIKENNPPDPIKNTTSEIKVKSSTKVKRYQTINIESPLPVTCVSSTKGNKNVLKNGKGRS